MAKERWKNVRVGEGVRYVTESGMELPATVTTVHEPEMEDVVDPESGDPTGERKLAEGEEYGKIDLSVRNPANALDEPRTMESVPHSLKNEPNSWHYAV